MSIFGFLFRFVFPQRWGGNKTNSPAKGHDVVASHCDGSGREGSLADETRGARAASDERALHETRGCGSGSGPRGGGDQARREDPGCGERREDAKGGHGEWCFLGYRDHKRRKTQAGGGGADGFYRRGFGAQGMTLSDRVGWMNNGRRGGARRVVVCTPAYLSRGRGGRARPRAYSSRSRCRTDESPHETADQPSRP